MDELESRFHKTQWGVAGAMIGIGLAVFVATHRLLIASNQYLAVVDGPARFILLPQKAIWWFLPGFASLTLSWDLTLFAWSLFGSKQVAREYEYWSNAKAGFNATIIFRVMTVVTVLPIALFTALALPEHDSLQETVIKSHGYGLAAPRTFSYSAARTLAVIEGFRTRDGRLNRRAGCVLYFSDGSKWSSAAIGDFKQAVDDQLLRFLQSKTGLQPKYAETESEIAGD